MITVRECVRLTDEGTGDRGAIEALRYAEDIIQTLRQPLVILDGNLVIRMVNRAFYDAFRLGPVETLGKKLYDLGRGQWGVPRLRSLLEEILDDDTHLTDFEVRAEFDQVGPRVMLLNARRIERRDAGATTILLAIEDVTERRRAEELLTEAALTDKMTGLYNRRGLHALGNKLLDRLRREEAPVHLVFADLDQLKRINDRFGHAEGDKAIVSAARLLRGALRESDILARYGGDEFLALLVGATGDEAGLVCARIERAFQDEDSTRGYPLAVSVGTIRAEVGPGTTLEDLILRADTAMYREKKRRRGLRVGSDEGRVSPRG